MKRKALLLIAIMAVAITATARVSYNQRPVQQQNNRVAAPNEKIHGTVKNMTRFDASLRIPDGDLKTYKRSGQYVYVKNGYLYRGFQTDKVDIVYADNNVVYLKNILCGAKNYFGDNFWVQGTINDAGTEITVPMGQSLYANVNDGTEVILGWGITTDAAADVSYRIDEDVTEVVYAIDGDKISCLGTSGLASSDSYAATGLSAYWSDDDSWTGFIECNTVLTETAPVAAPQVIAELPEGCEVSTYAYKGGCVYGDWTDGWATCNTRGKIDVAFAEDGVVYLRNPLWWHNSYNTWVQGTFDPETGIISVPTGQYLAWSDKSGYGIQLKWGSTHIVENGIDDDGKPVYELRYSVDESTKQICYQVDGNKLYLIGSEEDSQATFPYNYEATSVIAVFSDNQMMDAMEFGIDGTELREDVEWGVPEMPWANNCFFDGYYEGYCNFFFTLPEYDVNGNYLDPEHLSYSIYANGDEMIAFDPDYYPELSDWTTEITYEIWSQNNYFGYDYAIIYGYWWDCYAMGIQAHYTVNGEKYSSDITVCHIDMPTGTTELPDMKPVSSVRYFNVMGQEIPAPEGLTIKVTTYTDGTTSATKLIK